MRSRLLSVCAAGSILATWLAACGSVEIAASSSTTSGSGGASSTASAGSTTATTSTGFLVGSGGAMADAAPDTATDAPLLMPGPFDCNGCLCNGATHYCNIVHGGPPKPPPGPPPEPPCPDDGGPTYCVLLPAQCLSDLSCACPGLVQNVCSCVAAGGGITVTCNLP